MKYKNLGRELRTNPPPTKEGLKDPKNLARYENKAERTTKSNLSRGAFGGVKC